MNTEQKAKAYDEAIERAKRMFSEKELNYLFPELKESEDERIRKDVLAFIRREGQHIDKYKWHKWIAWLEKQGKQDARYKYLEELLEADTIYQMAMNDAMVEEAKMKALEAISNMEIFELLGIEKQGEQKSYGQRKECLDCQFNYACECKGSCQMKRDEQKLVFSAKHNWYVSKVDGKIYDLNYIPTDKVEPKFKVGDWIVYNRNDSSREILYVYDIRDGRYYFNDNIHFSWSVKECDEKSHLWTIQDAKDGDVLSGNYGTFIFMGENDGYCGILSDNSFIRSTGNNEWTECLYPATKEQCELLFQKMRESGYEWDYEKKELRKIENASDNESQKLGEFISELSKQFPEVSFAKLSRIAVRVAKWVRRNK